MSGIFCQKILLKVMRPALPCSALRPCPALSSALPCPALLCFVYFFRILTLFDTF